MIAPNPKILLTFWLIGLVIPVLRTNGSVNPITGRVLDKTTNQPLPYTNIRIAGQQKGTISNPDGYFVIDLPDISRDDTLWFSFMGYRTYKIAVSDLMNKEEVYLEPATLYLNELEISSREMDVKEIITLIRRNYEKNYPASNTLRNLFFHKYSRVPFSEKNQIIVRNSDFPGLDRKTAGEVLRMMPREFTDYQDALIDLYHFDEQNKVVPVKGISLEEGSQQVLFRMLEDKLNLFFEDMERNKGNEDIYYKFKSGVFSQKIKENSVSDSLWQAYRTDTLNYTVETDEIKHEILFLLQQYADIGSKNWEFITHPGRYDYHLEEVTYYDEEPVYKISFIPDAGGLFEGTLFVSTQNYAILHLDFAFAPGKQSERFHLLGFGHSMDFKKGRIIYEKGKTGYSVKYISAEQFERASVDRNLAVMRKKKRFLTDKELNIIELELRMFFEIKSHWELLVLDRDEIDASRFDKVIQPLLTRYKKEFAYSPGMWDHGTVIVPNS